MKQRIKYAIIQIGRPEQRRSMLLGSGVLPGDHAGPRFFNRVMKDVGNNALLSIKHRTQHAEKLFFTCFLYPDMKSCAALTGFVDDVAGNNPWTHVQGADGQQEGHG